MTAKLEIRRRPVVDERKALRAAQAAMVDALRKALARAGLVDTGAMQQQLAAPVRGDALEVSAAGDRRIAAAVHQARIQWAELSADERRAVAEAIRAANPTRKRRTPLG